MISNLTKVKYFPLRVHSWRIELTTYALFYDGLSRSRGFIVFVNKGSPLTTPLLVKWAILRFLLSWDRKIHAEPYSGFWKCTKLIRY
jgi:hypothetical protein